MSLEALSNEISMQAEAEAKSIIDDAKAEAKGSERCHESLRQSLGRQT